MQEKMQKEIQLYMRFADYEIYMRWIMKTKLIFKTLMFVFLGFATGFLSALIWFGEWSYAYMH